MVTSGGPVVAIVPDSFKGSATAREVAEAMARGARSAFGDAAEIRLMPLADGGEGTLDALLGAWQGHECVVEVTDAIGRPRRARYGLSEDGTSAIIEAAEANGLPHVSDVPLQPLRADSAGVGILARAALEAGADEILLCIGGSASTDGGAGVLTALGARFLDASGAPVAPGGGALTGVRQVDLDGLHPRARSVRWRIAVDVDNPLTGPRGAAATFGPQKGASPDDVARLDAALGHAAQVLAHAAGHDVDAVVQRAGMGAAGGLPLALSVLLGAETVPGIELVAEAVDLRGVLRGADVILTGEGSFDAQSLHGKVVDGVRTHAPSTAAIVVIAGRMAVPTDTLAEAGITAALSIATDAASRAELVRDAISLIENATLNACRLLAHRLS